MTGDQSTVLNGLIQRIRTGDAAAIGELVVAAQRRIEALAATILNADYPDVKRRGECDTVELLQELSCRMLDVLQTVPPNDVKHFMCIVAQHVRWHLGEIVRSPRAGAIDAPSGIPQGNSSRGEWSTTRSPVPSQAAVGAKLQCVLGEMPKELEEIIDLKLVWGFTHQEIAVHLDVSEKYVQRHWNKAVLACYEGLVKEFPSLDHAERDS